MTFSGGKYSMQCNGCGQQSDTIGSKSRWRAVTDRSVTHKLFECGICGGLQRRR